jgi:hypothetical protein
MLCKFFLFTVLARQETLQILSYLFVTSVCKFDSESIKTALCLCCLYTTQIVRHSNYEQINTRMLCSVNWITFLLYLCYWFNSLNKITTLFSRGYYLIYDHSYSKPINYKICLVYWCRAHISVDLPQKYVTVTSSEKLLNNTSRFQFLQYDINVNINILIFVSIICKYCRYEYVYTLRSFEHDAK